MAVANECLLNINAVISCGLDWGEAIHPGFGFLVKIPNLRPWRSWYQVYRPILVMSWMMGDKINARSDDQQVCLSFQVRMEGLHDSEKPWLLLKNWPSVVTRLRQVEVVKDSWVEETRRPRFQPLKRPLVKPRPINNAMVPCTHWTGYLSSSSHWGSNL